MARLLQQYGALPWRDRGQGIEVLLISSRETRRWIIPKGWPIPGLEPHDSAAREAFEEAGVGGNVGRRRLGSYDYEKRLKDGSLETCTVDVFRLEVMIQHRAWPEQGQRELRWLTRDEAAASVQEAGLASLIRKLK
ncbi:MAG: NUDIX hydrolase [Hyphomicrobiales bacterium]